MQEVVDRLGEVENLDHYDVANLSVGRRIVYDVRANWKLIIENFMECYHCATIHPELTEVLPEFADGYAAQYFVNHGAEFGEGIEGFHRRRVRRASTCCPGIDPDQDRKYYAITIKPQVFVNMVPDHIILHRMFPMAVDRTVVECDWLFLPDVVESGKDVSQVGGAVRPGQPAGLRGLRAVPAVDVVTDLHATAGCWCRASTTSGCSTTGCGPDRAGEAPWTGGQPRSAAADALIRSRRLRSAARRHQVAQPLVRVSR